MNNDTQRYLAMVKWFNTKSGFGFMTLLNHEQSPKDVFVHITNLVVDGSVYRMLYSGEYVECSLSSDANGKEQATQVTGVVKGPLMCETNSTRRRSEYQKRSASTDGAPVCGETN